MKNIVDMREFERLAPEFYRSQTNKQLFPKQLQLWLQIAEECNAKILNKDNESKNFTIIPHPTGIGKTSAMVAYFAALARQNQVFPKSRTRGLIVVPEIKQADQIVESINKTAERQVAAAHHSESSPASDLLDEFDFLVVTHSGYALALSSELDDYFSPKIWLYSFADLVVIDENPEELVETFSVNVDEVEELVRLAAAFLPNEYQREQEVLSSLVDFCRDHKEAAKSELTSTSMPNNILNAEFELNAFGVALSEQIEAASLVELSKDNDGRTLIRPLTRDLQFMLRNWFWLRSVAGGLQLLSSRFLLAEHERMPIILDATAHLMPTWQHPAINARIVSPIVNARTYKNVRLLVSRENGNGKLSKKQKQRFESVLDTERANDVEVLVVSHKKHLEAFTKLAGQNPKFHRGHWFSINGKNDWVECRRAYFTTLPFLPGEVHSLNELALDPPSQGTVLFRHDVETSIDATAANLIQAINRTACRVPIDSDGNCVECVLHLYLPEGKRGDIILDRITEAMPGIQVLDWRPIYNTPPDVGRSNVSKTMFAWVLKNPGTKTTTQRLSNEYQLFTDTQRNELHRMLRNENHRLTRTLKNLGVEVSIEGEGRNRTYHLRIPEEFPEVT
ncbi:RAD3-like DEAD/DEAH box helicase [Maritalea mobilis]|uniref:RAD3-like DEAD/DEAH box helicase n=1 Tax=Maritalea mobilis TaxID=483324 RepID=A0A4R6VM22_9HYPH|nr:DEAD/DEAH box helicase family protein [Maritalea mobilis]TDQ60209.1 RAD3-like DEAD/DEAH box helicase [Maritalea mobilis]